MWGCTHHRERQWIRTTTKFAGPEGSRVDLDPNITQSSDDHHRDTLSVDHRREIHGILQTTHDYLFLFTFPPSMLFDVSKTWLPVFWKIMVRNRKYMNFCPKRWGLHISFNKCPLFKCMSFVCPLYVLKITLSHPGRHKEIVCWRWSQRIHF